MATLGDSPSSFIGKPWSTWGDYIKNKQTSDVGSSGDEKKPKVESDSMKLRSEDMPLYGLCPAQDEFFLVMCERCGQVIKPQALQRHIELRHEQKSVKKSKSPGSHRSGQARFKSSKHSPTKQEEEAPVLVSHGHDHSTEKNRKNHGMPFVKVERISSEKISKRTSSSIVEPKYDKPKLSFKETYKESNPVEANSGDDMNVGFVQVKEEKVKQTVDSITVKKEPGFEEVSSDYKEEPGGIAIKVESSSSFDSDHSNSSNKPSAVNVLNSEPTPVSEIKVEASSLKVEKEPIDYGMLPHSHLVPECIEELTRTAEPPVPQMVEETACAVEAIYSQDLVDKLFGKSESQVSEIPKKIKVQEEPRHVIEIDNRSSTPILHIPSPKSESAHYHLSDSPTVLQTTTPPQTVIISSSTGSTSKPNSRPPSRTHSRPPSRQPSQPSTPLTKGDTILLDSYDIGSQLSRLNALQESSSGTSSSNEKSAVSVVLASVSPSISPVVAPQKSIFSSSSGVPFKEKKCIPCKDRVYDPERHCGAWIVDQGRHCTRSLTCKTHALSVRRAVQGRSKSFDQLLLEHRGAKEAEALRKAKASSENMANKGLSRIAMATKTVTTTTTTTVMSNCNTKQGKQNSQQLSAVKQPVTNILSYSHTPKPAVFPVLSRSRPLPLPIPLGGHVTSEGEEDEEGDSIGYPCLQHHPRPAAVNSWGSRQYGRGCYTFNQRCDLLRSAFSSLVDVHNHSPPHKKLCLDPKSVQPGWGQSGGAQDPYDFSFGESNSSTVHSLHSNTTVHHGGTLITKHKSKVPVNLLNKSVKHKDSSIDSKSVSSSSKPSSSTNTGSKTILSSGLKRKRSGSGVTTTQTTTAQVATVSMPAFSSPLSITIPAGINLATLNNATLNSTLKAQTKNNLNIVVSNTTADQNSGTFTNGQLLNIPAGINLDVSQLSQLSNLTQGTVSTGNSVGGSSNSTDGKSISLQKVAAKGTTAKLIPALQKGTLTAQKAHPFHIELGNGNAGPVMAALQTGTVVMDTGQSQGTTFLTSSQVAGLPTATAISNNPSQAASATGIVFKKEGQLANGVLPHGGNLHPKTLPLSINHLASSDPSQLTATAITQITRASKLQGRNSSLPGSKVSSLPKNMTATLKPAVATLKPAVTSHLPLSRTAPQIAATINLSHQGSSRFITPGNIQQVYATNQVINPLQLQPKVSTTTPGAKTQATGTKLLQPMSLTIVAPPGGIAGLGGPQARPLLINSDTSNGKSQLSDVVSSPGSIT